MKNQISKIVDLLNDATDYVLVTVNNIYCDENSYSDSTIYSNDEQFLQEFFGNNIDNMVRAICFGKYEYNDNWVKFNGYGNLETFSDIGVNDLVESVETIAEYIFQHQELFNHFLDLEFDDEEIIIVRQYSDYSLCQRGNWYYVDNGEDDVSNEFDEIEADEFDDLNDEEFLEKCESYF